MSNQPVADLGIGAGQHEGRADIGMAGERQLGLGREDADLGGMCRIAWRQDEGRLGQVEFGGDGLHLAGAKAHGVQNDGQRIAAELPVGEDVDGDELEFHDSKSATPR